MAWSVHSAFCRKHRLTETLPYRTTLPSIPRLHSPLGRPKLFKSFLRIVDLLASARRALRAASSSLPRGCLAAWIPAFGLLAFTLFTAALLLRGKNIPLIRTALFCTLITILLATLLELLQLVLPHRSADWRDILWATLGALTATLLSALILKLLRR